MILELWQISALCVDKRDSTDTILTKYHTYFRRKETSYPVPTNIKYPEYIRAPYENR